MINKTRHHVSLCCFVFERVHQGPIKWEQTWIGSLFTQKTPSRLIFIVFNLKTSDFTLQKKVADFPPWIQQVLLKVNLSCKKLHLVVQEGLNFASAGFVIYCCLHNRMNHQCFLHLKFSLNLSQVFMKSTMNQKYVIDIIDQRKLQEQNSQKGMSKILAVLFSLLPKLSIDLEILHKEYRF